MGVLGRVDGVQHNGKIAAGGIFHSGRNIKAADGQPMLLIFDRTCADGHVGKNVRDITPIFGIQHFIRRRQTGFVDGAYLHFTHSDQPGKEVGFFFRIRLMNDTFITFSCSARFISINSGNQDKPVLHLLMHFCQPGYVVADGIFVIRGAGADNDKELIALSGKNFPDFLISLLL